MRERERERERERKRKREREREKERERGWVEHVRENDTVAFRTCKANGTG